MKNAKPKLGELRYVDGTDGKRKPIIIAGRETHNHRDFYRATGPSGALWLAQSLYRSPQDEPR